jgi:uncharacterized protein YcaQ
MLALEGLGMRHKHASTLEVVERLGLLQVDSVNVFERAHYLPLFSRMGSFDKSQLDDLQTIEPGNSHPKLIEYWAHEASLIPIERLPLYKFRMDAAHDDSRPNRWRDWANSNQDLCQWILNEIGTKGPLTVSQIEHDSNVRKGSWWGWSDAKQALEWLFMTGELVSGGRDKFSRRYALPEQVLPAHIVERLHTVDNHQARKTLLTHAAGVHAVATDKDLADYHRMKLTTVRPLLRELVEEGKIRAAKVAGWKEPAFISLEAAASLNATESAKSTNPTTILSPFDPVVWNRDRALRMFNFDYRIEIYTPKEKRIFGYYSLPILHNRKLIGRVDLKSDRQNSALLVQSCWAENWLDDKQKASAAAGLAKNLKDAQKWQKLDQIKVEPAGNLSAETANALGVR